LLAEPFGKRAAEVILEAALSEKWDFLGQRMDHFHRVILQRALLRRPFFQIRQWVRYHAAIWRARLSPPHGFFITLLAPKLEADIRDDGSIVPLKPIKAAIYAAYLALEYLTGHPFLRWWKSNGGLVVFDRYFYDHLVFEDFQRVPAWLLRLLARVVPRPDALIYLQNDPQTIHARKPERSVPEIARQAGICEELVALLPPAYTIQTSKKPEEIVEEIKEIIIRNLRERNRHFSPR
jgi:hypothetical protein